ncbi:MAG TPA: ornithine cyclodeaminase family protein [Vicinamibacterales bacterium]|nr:ornithine cyclodeaminase family protein [Vicinamibacterales bacterium]
MDDETIVLGARDVARFLPIRECIDATAGTLRAHEAGKSRGPASSGFALPGGSFHAKLAAIEDNGRVFVAVKANVNLPGNPLRHGRPTIQGALILLDGDNGRPLAIMDAITLTSLRTAAVAALAAEHLALPDSRTVTIVGCGEQGQAQLRAMAAVRPLRAGFAVDLDSAKAAAFAGRMSGELGWRVQASIDLSAAVAASDICVTCTTSASPLLFAEHLHPGLFVAAVGADNPAKQEVDYGALVLSRVVVDSLAACAAGGDLHHAIKANVMTEKDVHGELSAIVAGRRSGRTGIDEVFIFDSTGTALQDVAAAVLVYQRATDAAAGVRVLLDDRHAAVAEIRAQ